VNKVIFGFHQLKNKQHNQGVEKKKKTLHSVGQKFAVFASYRINHHYDYF